MTQATNNPRPALFFHVVAITDVHLGAELLEELSDYCCFPSKIFILPTCNKMQNEPTEEILPAVYIRKHIIYFIQIMYLQSRLNLNIFPKLFKAIPKVHNVNFQKHRLRNLSGYPETAGTLFYHA